MKGSILEISFKNRKGEEKKVVIPPNRIFIQPDLTDDPLIFWVWEKRLKPAFVIRSKSANQPANVLVINLHSLRGMKDCPEDIIGCTQYLSAVMVEELSHCACLSLRNHKQWIGMLQTLQEELHEDDT
jgi:hypothetical protein